MVEILALWTATELAVELNIQEAISERDAQMVTNAVLSKVVITDGQIN